jgi:hypothetical protein
MFHYPYNVLAISDNFEQIFVANEVEAREGSSLPLKILAESLLYLVKQVRKPLEALLDALDIHDVRDEWRFIDFLHDGQEFGINVLKPRTLHREEMFDVGAPRKDTFQVHPLTLNVDPYVF